MGLHLTEGNVAGRQGIVWRRLLEQFQEKCERFSVRNCVKTKR